MNEPQPHPIDVLAELRRRLEQCEREKHDLELMLQTTIDHGDAIEEQLCEANRQLEIEIGERLRVEESLNALLRALAQQKKDLELLVKLLSEHGDELDIQWIEKLRRLEEEARHDALTGLPNRRALGEVLEREWRDAVRSDQPLSLLLCDVDHFKRYNDTLGHPAGDKCLHEVAQCLRTALLRPRDSVARYGGEEFCVILPATDRAGAREVAEVLLTKVAALGMVHPDSPYGCVTLSIGTASCRPRAAGESPVELLARADQSLYRAKQKGRNRLHQHEDES
ncbi:MAG: diguanylate cyclase [Halothiobacillaceae bacterium]|jgi:diguanylate cyclase (GGDEF)-like protein|nr:diguanylate cyclase [Halothiobacillaceae bacterium]